MKARSIARTAAVVAAFHLVMLGFVCGSRHIGFILIAVLSATLIWGVALSLEERNRKPALIAGAALAVAIEQITYHAWRSDLGGLWGSAAQFGALQLLVALAIGRSKSRRGLQRS